MSALEKTPAPTPDSPATNALMIIFPGFNTFDMNGPYEILRDAKFEIRGDAIGVTVASETEITTATEGTIVKRNIPLDEDLVKNVAKFDMLVVVGGPEKYIDAQVKAGGPLMDVIKRFAEAAPLDGQPERILLSICSGAIFLGYCGVFDGMYCTTHWLSLNSLKTANAEGARPTCDKPGTVIRARYVDAGLNAAGVRIISSGGVSCGLDASLHVISLRTGPGIKGEEEARRVADFIDYGWRKTEGVAFLP